MSEDRVERALQEMKDEDVDGGTLEAARARVWEQVTNAGNATCAEFRQDLHAYLVNELGASRRILVEDHLSRCPGCRARIADMKGERRIVAMPLRSSSRWMHRAALAAAAALILGSIYLGRDAIDVMMAPDGPRATVVSADGGLYRLPVGAVAAGAQGPAQAAQAEGFLTQALRSLFAVVENYPELKANQNVLELQEQLTTTENQIGFSRQHYNATVLDYNQTIATFPSLLLAGPLGFTRRDFFEAEPEAAEVPVVALR